MASTIKLKNGSGAPLASDLVQGEPAFDLTNKRLYTEDASGTVIEVGINPSSLTTSSADINGGTIDGTVIGGSSAAAGSFTTISASGEIAANGGVAFGDNDKATFGASDDLQIYHSGSHSFITDSGTGSLFIGGDTETAITNAAGTEYKLRTFTDGSVSLYYDNAIKLATTSTGIDVTGAVTADGLTVDGQIQTNIATTGRSILAVLTNTAALAVNNQATIQLRNSGQSAFISGESVQANAGIDIVLSSNDGGGTETVKARFAENGDISFYEDTGTTAKLFWDASAESLGIGTSSPSAQLHVKKDQGGFEVDVDNQVTDGVRLMSYDRGASTDRNMQYRAATHLFNIGSTEAMRIDSSGNVGIGTTSPSHPLTVQATSSSGNALKLLGDPTNNSARILWRNNADTSETGRIAVDGSANLTFHNGSSGTERMRIDSSGNLLVGTTSNPVSSSSVTGFFYSANEYLAISNDDAPPLYLNRLTGDGDIVRFRKNGSTVGSISVTGSATAYNTSSDYRLKENVVSMANASDRVLALNPVRFNFIADPDKTVDGFLAHEAQEVVPEAVTGSKDAMTTEEYEVSPAVLDEDGNVVTEAVMGTREVPDYQGIDQSKLVPLLTKALQEALERIAVLESKVGA